MPRTQPIDDRGNPCGIASLTGKQTGWRALGLPGVVPDEITRLEQAKTGGLEAGVSIAGGVVGSVLYQLLLVRPMIDSVGWGAVILGWIVVPMVFATITWWLFLGRIRSARYKKLFQIYLSLGRCGSCGYELTDLPTSTDGYAACPECNASWLSGRIRAALDEQASPDHAGTPG